MVSQGINQFFFAHFRAAFDAYFFSFAIKLIFGALFIFTSFSSFFASFMRIGIRNAGSFFLAVTLLAEALVSFVVFYTTSVILCHCSFCLFLLLKPGGAGFVKLLKRKDNKRELIAADNEVVVVNECAVTAEWIAGGTTGRIPREIKCRAAAVIFHIEAGAVHAYQRAGVLGVIRTGPVEGSVIASAIGMDNDPPVAGIIQVNKAVRLLQVLEPDVINVNFFIHKYRRYRALRHF